MQNNATVTIEVPAWIVEQIRRDQFVAVTTCAQLVQAAIADWLIEEDERQA